MLCTSGCYLTICVLFDYLCVAVHVYYACTCTCACQPSTLYCSKSVYKWAEKEVLFMVFSLLWSVIYNFSLSVLVSIAKTLVLSPFQWLPPTPRAHHHSQHHPLTSTGTPHSSHLQGQAGQSSCSDLLKRVWKPTCTPCRCTCIQLCTCTCTCIWYKKP